MAGCVINLLPFGLQGQIDISLTWEGEDKVPSRQNVPVEKTKQNMFLQTLCWAHFQNP